MPTLQIHSLTTVRLFGELQEYPIFHCLSNVYTNHHLPACSQVIILRHDFLIISTRKVLIYLYHDD